MNIIYCRSSGAVGFLIRLFTLSKWNHVAIEHKGNVIDSTFKAGVAVTSKEKFLKKYPVHAIRKINGVNEEVSWKFLKAQLGKGYDYKAIVALPFREDWQRDSKWFCSELAAAAIIKGGRKLKLKPERVTPGNLWDIL